MTNYINNTIFTEYALNKINNNLVQNYSDFNFTKVKISNVMGALEQSRNKLTKDIYNLKVDEVTLVGGVFHLYCTIPDTVEGLTLSEIGIYETIDGEDKLFALAISDVVKPANLQYKLYLTVDLSLSIVNLYPSFSNVKVLDYNYLNILKKQEIECSVDYVTTNLERCILKNSTKIGYNKSQVNFKKEQENNKMAQEVLDILKYSKLNKFLGDYIISSFFFPRTLSLQYTVKDLHNENVYLTVLNSLISSHNDNISFGYSRGTTLFINMKVINKTSGIILCKQNVADDKKYFSFYIENDYLKVTLFGTLGKYTVKYKLSSNQVFLKDGEDYNFFILFNGDSSQPSIKMFIENTELVLEEEREQGFGSLTQYSFIPLTNYIKNTDNTIEISNNVTINNITLFSKELTNEEVKITSLSMI